MKIDSYAFSVIGGREENQDAFGRITEGENAFFAVADGLGGHRLGSLASSGAIAALLQIWNADDVCDAERMTGMFGKANDAVLDIQKEMSCSAKSTAVVLHIQEGKAIWANTGDSRLYYIHGGELAAYTEDHSVAYKKYRSGEISRAEIPTDEDQSALLRVLGSPTRWQPDVSAEKPLAFGDAFLLCSDGFWEYVSDEEILIDCLKTDDARAWAEQMLVRVAARVPPDNDNMTLITVRISK